MQRSPQRVERVLCGARAGRDGGNHRRFAAADEGVAQHLRELRPSEGGVRRARIEGADALLPAGG
eukprot:6872198-Prymnesium_polylepis.1